MSNDCVQNLVSGEVLWKCQIFKLLSLMCRNSKKSVWICGGDRCDCCEGDTRRTTKLLECRWRDLEAQLCRDPNTQRTDTSFRVWSISMTVEWTEASQAFVNHMIRLNKVKTCNWQASATENFQVNTISFAEAERTAMHSYYAVGVEGSPTILKCYSADML